MKFARFSIWVKQSTSYGKVKEDVKSKYESYLIRTTIPNCLIAFDHQAAILLYSQVGRNNLNMLIRMQNKLLL